LSVPALHPAIEWRAIVEGAVCPISRPALPQLLGARMDRTTKATLWVAFTILISYVVWFYLDCAMDDACRIVCRRGCHTEWTPASK
jgi:hypothetical protein